MRSKLNFGIRVIVVSVLAFGTLVDSPFSQATVQSNTAVDATVNGSDTSTLTDLGSKVNLKTMSPVADAGSLTQSVTQMIDNTRMVLTGLSDITAPADWTLSYTTDGSTWSTTTPTTAAGWAAVSGVKATGPVVSSGADGSGLQISTGDATQAYPTGGSMTSNGGGDGYNLTFDARGNIYNIWHHDGAGTPGVHCHTRSGAVCAGAWPFTWPLAPEDGPHTMQKSYGWYDQGENELWFATYMTVDGVRKNGFACIDIRISTAPQFCGGSKSTGFIGVQTGGGGNVATPVLAQAGGKIFTVNASTGDILCVDIRANFGMGAPCPTPTLSFPSFPSGGSVQWDGTYGGFSYPTMVAVNGRIYGHIAKSIDGTTTFDGLYCVEPATMTQCAGWAAANGDPSKTGTNWYNSHAFPLPNAAGEIQGVCFKDSWGSCYHFDGTAFSAAIDGAWYTTFTNFHPMSTYQLDAYGLNDPVVSGSRIFSSSGGYIRCWDMALNGACPNVNGKLLTAGAGNYTVDIDPFNETCIWTNSDPGTIQTVDTITGSNSCTPRSIAFDAGTIVPRMGCNSTSSVRAWKEFKLTSPTAANYTSATLTVKTEEGVNVTGWVNKPLTTGTAIDLSTLPVADTGQRPKFVVNFVNRTSGTDASAQVSAIGDSPELCLTPTTIKCASTTGNGPYGSNVLLPAGPITLTGKGDWTDGSNVLNNLTNDSSTLNMPQSLFGDCATKITGTAYNKTYTTGAPVAGVPVTLVDATTGNALTYPSTWPDTNLRGQEVKTTTASDGTYDLGWVFAGTYKVKFGDIPTTQVSGTKVVTGSTAATKTTTDSGFATTTLTSIAASPIIGTNAVVDAIYLSLPTINKKFTPSTIAAGGSGVLVFEITNSPGNPAQSGLSFTDTLPSGLVIAAVPRRQGNCGPGGNTIYDDTGYTSATPGGTTFTATNFPIDAGVASCFFSVDVTSTTGGTYTNGPDNLVTTGLAPPNTSTLTVAPVTNSKQFLCTNALYHNESTQIYVTDNNFSRSYKLGPSQANVTGLGFNQLDGYLYGIVQNNYPTNNVVSGHLVKVDSTGTIIDLGALTGPPLPQANITGTMDANGHLALWGWLDPSKLYIVDVYTRVTTTITMTGYTLSSNFQDFAYSDGKYYFVGGDKIRIVDPATGVMTQTSFPTGTALLTVTSTYITPDDRMFIYAYGPYLYKEVVGYKTNSPTLVNVSDWGNYVEYSDGASCADATPPPATRPDATYGASGATQTVNPLTNDWASSMVGAALDPTSVKLCQVDDPATTGVNEAQTPPNCTATTVTKPDGTYAVNNLGEIVFTPNPTFGGGPTSGITYQVSDNKGETSSNTYTPTVVAPPVANADTTSAAYMVTQTINPVTNDTVGVGGAANGVTLSQSSVRLCGGSDTAPNCTQTSVIIPGQGSYVVDTTTGIISFLPLAGFYGTATPITYSVTDSLGQKSSSTYTPTSVTAPRLSKDFDPNTVAVGGVATMLFTISNTTPAAAWTGLGFVDTLPTGLTVDDNPNTSKTCTTTAGVTSTSTAGTLTATAASGTITLTGASLTATQASCLFAVEVTASATGTYTNGAGNINSTTVMPPTNPAVLKVETPITTGGYLCNPYVFTARTGGELWVQNPITGNAYKVGASAGGEIQALGYNSLDGYLYGYVRTALTSPVVAAGHIVKISNDGTVSDVGFPKLNGVNLAANANVYAGDMDDSGNLFFLSNYTSTTTAYLVNVNTLVTRQITLSTGIARQDVAYFKGKFYTAESSIVYAITPSSISDSWNVLSKTITNAATGTQQAAYSNSAEWFYMEHAVKFRMVNNIDGAAAGITVSALGPDTFAGQKDGAGCHQAAGIYTPAAYDDTITTAYNVSQTYTPASNDVASLNATAIDPTSVKLCDPTTTPAQTAPNCAATTLVVANQGTFTVNQTTGEVVFVPLSSFTGNATPISYQVGDGGSNKASAFISPIIGPPPPSSATNDASSGGLDINQTVNPLTNDTVTANFAFVPTSVKLCATGTTTGCNLTTLTIAGQGTYSVNATTGEITFDPLPSYTGTPTPVRYVVSDTSNQTASAVYQPVVIGAPTATNDTSVGNLNTAQTITPLTNDSAASGATLASHIQGLCTSSTANASCTATTLNIPGEGTYTLNSNNTVTFVPVTGFTGAATPIKYVIADSLGQLSSATITPTVKPTPIDAVNDTVVLGQDKTTQINVLANDIAGTGTTKSPNSVKLCALDNPATTSVYDPEVPPNCTQTTLTVPNEGTYTVNPDGSISFDPLPNFVGPATPITYQVSDSFSAAPSTDSATLSPTVVRSPTVINETPTGAQDVNQVIDPLANDSFASGYPPVLNTSGICKATIADASCTGTTVTTTDGVYTLDKATGLVTFDPNPTFTGTVTEPVHFVVSNSLGQTAVDTITPNVVPRPTASNDTSIGSLNTSQTISPLSNDIAGTGATLASHIQGLCTSATANASCTSSTVTIPGEGTYTLNSDNTVTFVPVTGFTDAATPIKYVIADSLGQLASATITPTVKPVPIDAVNDTVVLGQNKTTTVNPLSNDAAGTGTTVNPTSVKLCALDDPATTNISEAEIAPNCTKTTLVVPNEGTYTVNPTTGAITFDPLPTFVGTATAVTYQVSDNFSAAPSTDSATLRPTVIANPTVVNETPTGAQNVNQVIDPIANDTFPAGYPPVLSTSGICAANVASASCAGTTVTTADGVYTLDKTTGLVTFDPNPTFTGTATEPVHFVVSNSLGQTAVDTITPTVAGVPTVVADTSTGAWNVPQSTNVLTNDTAYTGHTLDTGSVKLCGPSDTAPNCTQTSVTVAGQGTYTIGLAGEVIFTPLSTFRGTATPVTYSVSDDLNQKSSTTYTPTVSAPALSATPQAITLVPGTSDVFLTVNGAGGLSTGAGLTTTAPCLIDPATSQCDTDNVITIAGQGTFTLNPATGVVTYAADSNATSGTKTAVTYKVTDITGQSATSTLTPILPPPPAVSPDTSLGAADMNQTVSVLGNDLSGTPTSALVPTSVKLCDISETSPNCTKTTLVVPNVGTYTVNNDGTITFDPLSEFASDTQTKTNTVIYQVSDIDGQTSSTTLTTKVVPPPAPVAVADAASANYGATSITFTPSSNDLAYKNGWTPASSSYTGTVTSPTLVTSDIKLCAAGEVAPNCSATTITTDDGTYTVVDGATDTVVFTPIFGFVGTATSPVTYQIHNNADGATGNGYATSTLTPTINYPPAPTATPGTVTALLGQTVAFDPITGAGGLASGTGLVTSGPGATCLIVPGSNPKVCDADNVVTIANYGTYTLNPTTGVVTFAALISATQGAAPAIEYQVTDATGQTATSTLTPTIDGGIVANPDTSVAGLNVDQVIDVTNNDSVPPAYSIPPNSVKLCGISPAQTSPNCSLTTLTVVGEGTYTVDPAIGDITFNPVDTYVGTATTVSYQAATNTGVVASSTITPTVVAAPQPSKDATTGNQNVDQVISPLSNDTFAIGYTPANSTVKICLDGTATASCNSTSLTIPGEGTYTVNANGTVTFDPVDTFTGTATPIKYVATDSIGQKDTATITATVIAAPVANPDTATLAQDVTTTVNLLANDTKDPSKTLVASTVKLCDTNETSPNCSATLLSKPEGTYTINPDGTLTFDPNSTYTGTPTGVTYQVSDNAATPQTVLSTFIPTVVAAPTVTANTSTGAQDVNQIINVLNNDSAASGYTLTPSSVKLCGADVPGTSTIDESVPPSCNVSTLTVAGEGTYTVNANGTVTFDPLPTFTGTATPVTYQVADNFGTTDSNSATNPQIKSATITPTVIAAPAPVADSKTDTQNVNQVFDPLANDVFASGYTPADSTLNICPTGTTAASCSGTSVTIPGQGIYILNRSTGEVTFDPLATFVGIATPIEYVATDSLGQIASSTINPTVIANPVAINDTLNIGQDVTTVISVLANDTAGSTTPLDATSVKLCDPTTNPAQAAPSCSATSLTIAGEGAYTVNRTTGAIEFNPDASFTGTTTPVTYQVSDTYTTPQITSATVTVTVVAKPTASPDTSTSYLDQNQTMSVLTNDTAASGYTLVNSTVKLCATGQSAPSCTATTVTISGQGTYTANANGTITFDPLPSFTGTATPVIYQVSDSLGTAQTASSTYTPTVLPLAHAVNDTSIAGQDVNQVISILTNDSASTSPYTLDAATVKLCAVDNPATLTVNEAQTAPNCTASSLTIASQGTYTVNANGTVTFDPLPSFTGTATSVTYTVSDTSGISPTVSATVTPTVVPAPTAVDNTITIGRDRTTNIDVLANDSASISYPLDATSVKLCDPTTNPAQTAPSCAATTVVIPGVGTYTVNSTTGVIEFNPDQNFVGTTTGLDYIVKDTFTTAQIDSATITITVVAAPSASPDTSISYQDQNQMVSVVANDSAATGYSIVNSTLKLCGTLPVQTSPNCDKTTVTISSQGTYTANLDGSITFDPLPTFTGVATRITYQVSDNLNSAQSTSSTYTPTVVGLPTAISDTSTAGQDVTQTINILSNDSAATGYSISSSSVKLCQIDDPSTLGVNEAQTAPNCSATTVTVAGQGTYTVNNDGTVIFDPLPTYSGTATPVTYVVSDNSGITPPASATITPTVVAAPTAANDTSIGLQDVNQIEDVLSNNGDDAGADIAAHGYALDPTSVRLCDTTLNVDIVNPFQQLLMSLSLHSNEQAPNCTKTTIIISGQGTFTVDTTTGLITFDPEPTFVGTATAVVYQVSDNMPTPQIATALYTPTVVPPPAANNDSSIGLQNTRQLISPLGNDVLGSAAADFDVTSVKLCDLNEVAPNCSATTLTVVGQGTYVVNTYGMVIFVPEPAFTGTATPIDYQVADNLGQVVTATITAVVTPPPGPSAQYDSESGPYNTSITFEPWLNDTAGGTIDGVPMPEIDKTSIRLCSTQQTPPTCTSTSLTTDDGTYVVNTISGEVVFTPVDGFTGTATSPVEYQISNTWSGPGGPKTATAVLIPTIAAPGAPVAEPDLTTTAPGKSVVIDPLKNDRLGSASFDRTTVKLCDATEVAPSCSKTQVTNADGSYVVDQTTGLVTFTPADGFVGVATVPYTIRDLIGTKTNSNIVVTVAIEKQTPVKKAIKKVHKKLAQTGADNLMGYAGAAGIALLAGYGLMASSRRSRRRH